MEIAKLVRQVSGCSKGAAEAIANACKTASLNTLSRSQLVALGCKSHQANRLRAAFRLGERVHTAQTAAEAPATRKPGDAVNEIRKRFDIGGLEQEHFWVIALTARQKVLDVFTVGIGSLAQVDVHPREVFKPLVRMSAHSCVIAHNHPSNDPDPSDADVQITHRIAEVGRLVGIPVLDHLVITADDYCSLASLGLVPSC